MTTFYSTSSYKPQILSRTEGFHLPSPAPSTPPSSSDSTPGSANNSSATNGSSSTATNGFDTHNLFISPPSYLNVPETFRKFPGGGHGDTASSMDFSEELASLMANSASGNGNSSGHHPNSQERSTQSPSSMNGYDDYRPHTHNIFDISAPTTHHHHHSQSHAQQQQQQQQQPHSPYGSSAFSLPPTSSLHSHSTGGPHHHPSSLHTSTHPLHEFTATHSHFNSTLPAIGSSMRYEPGPPPPNSSSSSNHPFTLNPSGSSHGHGGGGAASQGGGLVGGEPSSVSSFSSHISNISSLSNFSNITTNTSDFTHHLGGQRQTPSPVSASTPAPPPHDFSSDFAPMNSRSRSRSRAPASSGNNQSNNPPSTNGGPTRRTRAKRNSISSVSPPPLHRHTQPLVIPGSNGVNGSGGAGGRGPASPLSLHTNGWFIPGPASAHGQGEFSLPTPESIHGGFSAFTSGLPSLPGLGNISPKEVNVPQFSLPGVNSVGNIGIGGMPGSVGGMGGVGVGGAGMKGGESPPGSEMASKQALIANEKRRRRRESHNAVERRRRDNINEKISELATLIPECLLDPNATLAVPTRLEGTGEDLIFGATAASPSPSESKKDKDGKDGKDSKDVEDEKDVSGKESKDSKEDSGAVKANKGMILRKSVEYIRYLQQLVSAQASRNRDLEQQLQTYRSGGTPTNTSSSTSASANGALNNSVSASSSGSTVVGGSGADGDEMSGLMLHEEVGDAFDGLLNGTANVNVGSSSTSPFGHHGLGGSRKFNGFELESVEEMDLEDDHHHSHKSSLHQDDPDHDEDMDHDPEHDTDRPGTSGTGMADETSPSAASLDDEGEEEEDRGRKGRDGARPGFSLGKGVVSVNGVKKEEGDMETS